MRCVLVLAAACLAMSSSLSIAQESERSRPVIDFGANVYAGETPFGASARGFADIVRSAGVYNYLTSEAMINVEVARKKYIENRLLWATTWNEIRTRNREYHRARYLSLNPPHTQEDFIRYAQADAPKRLTQTQLDPITGYIAWPRLLLLGVFADLRRDLEKLFAQRAAAHGAISNELYFTILAKIEETSERLRRMVKTVPPNDYTPAKRFLESLAYEVRFPSG